MIEFSSQPACTSCRTGSLVASLPAEGASLSREELLPLVLFVPYFRAQNTQRAEEIKYSILANIQSGIFARIVIIAEGGCEVAGLGVLPVSAEIVSLKGRTSYAEWIRLTRNLCLEPCLSILSNSDIVFGEDLLLHSLADTKEARTILCVTRWDLEINGGTRLHPAPHWSQDAWAIRSTDAALMSENMVNALVIQMGVPRCDNKVAYVFWLHGWKLVNPCHRIKILHNHASGIRGYQKKDPSILGGVAYVHPSPQSGVASEIELDIYTLNRRDPIDVNMNRYLCDNDQGSIGVSLCQSGGENKVAADGSSLLSWQAPNITEAHAAALVNAAGLLPSVAVYLAFPWASLIDRYSRGVHLPALSSAAHVSSSAGPCIKATVCQHIWALDYIDLFRQAGVTDLFWSHASIGLVEHSGVRIHPFPLYPVRCASHPHTVSLVPQSDRSLLYSFQGAYDPDLYLSAVREWILALPPRHDAKLELRREWHYEQAVYREQVLGQPADNARLAELSAEADAYADTLQNSCFVLCPSGSGPNSIRLWEALGYGAIPVILSDQLQLPGPPELWQAAALFVPETQEAVEALPSHLEAIASDSRRLDAMRAAGQQLWHRYGLKGFATDILEFLRDPLSVLCSRARQRLPAEPLKITASSPAVLPLEVRRCLRIAPPDCPLLIVITDQVDSGLLQVRWCFALQICADSVGARPWAVASFAPALECFGSTDNPL